MIFFSDEGMDPWDDTQDMKQLIPIQIREKDRIHVQERRQEIKSCMKVYNS